MEFSEIYAKYYSDIDPLTFEDVMTSDPTSTFYKCGHYVKWIANLYRKGQWKTGDRPETISALTLLEKHKAKLPENKRNINIYKSVSELYDIVKQFEEVKTQRELKSVGRDGAEKVYEDDEWLIVVPHTVEAAKQYGKHTKWCTSAENDNMFEYYNGKGQLYIFVDKKNNRKYQAHFETSQIRDEEDILMSMRKIGLNDNAKHCMEGVCNPLWFVYDYIGDFNEGLYVVVLDEMYNYINKDGKLLSPQWFDSAWAFKEGFAVVKLNEKYNFINKEVKYLSEQWFDNTWDFSEGFAKVYLNNKGWNFINKECEYLSQQWFDSAWAFREGLAEVKLNEKYNFINTEGKLLSEQWFDGAGYFSEGFTVVKLNGKWYFLNTKGQLFNHRWVLNLKNFFKKVII